MDHKTQARTRFAALLKALMPPVPEPPSDLLQTVRELPEPFLLPSPWATWLLVALVCYRQRQEWVQRNVRHYAPHAVPPSPELSEQEQPVILELNDTRAWPSHVELECPCGFGSAVDGINGEIVTFGLTNNTDGIFFTDTFFQSAGVDCRQGAVARFRELHSSELAIHHGLDELVAADLIEGIFFEERHANFGVAPDAYRLSAAAIWHRPWIERFCQRWEDEQQHLWLAATIGDWPKAHELAQAGSFTDLLKVTGPRAEHQRRERGERSQRSIATGMPSEVDRCVVQDLRLNQQSA